jgi:hypothetical protein
VFCGVLHHDDCGAAKAGRRRPLEQSLAELCAYLAREGITCPAYAGSITTHTSQVTW